MMYYIVLRENFPSIHKEFLAWLDDFKIQGFILEMRKYTEGEWVGFRCWLKSLAEERGNPDVLVLKRYLAEILTSYILDNLSYFLIVKLVDRQCPYFCKADKERIAEYAKQRLSESLIEDNICRSETKELVAKYLSRSNYINVEGFINFRMKEFTGRLRDIVDNSMDDFLSDKEYKEFIGLLKNFILLQEPKVELIHVTVNEEGVFEFRDRYFNPVNTIGMGEFCGEAFESELDCEDILVTTLITLAPKKIIIHKNAFSACSQAVETLEYIFENRVKICVDCRVCRNKNINLKDR